MSDARNHLGKVLLCILPFGLLCVVGWLADRVGRAAGSLDALQSGERPAHLVAMFPEEFHG